MVGAGCGFQVVWRAVARCRGGRVVVFGDIFPSVGGVFISGEGPGAGQ